ncbi:MAG: N-methylhydantoinase A [Gammaproteobacteria bacterium]|jgi:N-methylhydantoinase A
MSNDEPRLAVDIGGTFTDVALEVGQQRFTAKTLTTHDAPERGILTAFESALRDASVQPSEVSVIIYGTTLATNLLIERKGSPTALLTTEGFRDSIEMRNENRYEQYDLDIDLPRPLVTRSLRLPVRERMNAAGQVLVPLDESTVKQWIALLEREQVASVAVGYLHSYVNSAHEERTRDILARELPNVEVTLSSEVSPEMREYERITTACANAYVQPMMSSHLRNLEKVLASEGFTCPLYLMLSGGGITTLDTAVRFPVRLVESGPAGGAIFTSHIARELGLDKVVSYDMGGTTAKICLIDQAEPQTSRTFEVARVYRFLKGSGIPLRIPVIEMVEIGAGGGSIAHIDTMGRIAVGPESAGSEPGPVSYDKGGELPTVTDANVVLGRIDPENFAGGTMQLNGAAASVALGRVIGEPLSLDPIHAALGVSEMVDENMANAARVHAIESGKMCDGRTLVAFGGAAPLHAARIAEKLEMDTVVIPPGAGVGSAIGFLRAPVAYEVTRSHYHRLGALDVDAVNSLLSEMREEAYGVVRAGAGQLALVETRTAYMRYVGQGHEVGVEIPIRVKDAVLGADAATSLLEGFEAEYNRLYERTIPDLDVEVLTWVLLVSTERPTGGTQVAMPTTGPPVAIGQRSLMDTRTGVSVTALVYERETLDAGARVSGPAVIVEKDTATVVSAAFDAAIHPQGHIIMSRKGSA